jgi:SAM-dependent methyltransferase
MEKRHFNDYWSDRYNLEIIKEEGDEVIEGFIIPKDNELKKIPIINKIPRFVEVENYSANFGLQWNEFHATQLDSHSGVNNTAPRFWGFTKWTPEELKGKRVLEAGSGAGKFTEVFLGAGVNLVTFDYSNAVEANLKNNASKGDFFLFQGDIYDIPFPDGYCDYVFCYGVLQHTPNVDQAYKSLFKKLKPGGKISVDVYNKDQLPKFWPHYKYSWRKITTKIKPEKLLKGIKFYMPIWLPIDTFFQRWQKPFRIGPRILYKLAIPCWNYLDIGLTDKQRLEWAIMDTFDALGAKYDFPQTLEDFTEIVKSDLNETCEVGIGNNGYVANITKKK